MKLCCVVLDHCRSEIADVSLFDGRGRCGRLTESPVQGEEASNQASYSPLRLAGVALLTLAVAAFVAGCTTRTAGMQSPLAHDYDGLRWRPLDVAVEQVAIVAPAYTALVENDPATTSEQLLERIDLLPADVRAAELVEVRVAVRPIDSLAVDDEASVVVLVMDRLLAGDAAVVDRPLVDSTRDGDWLVIDDPPATAAGETLRILLLPGGSGAITWEYAIAPGRTPYGGEAAALVPGGDEVIPLDGAMGFQTVFAQNTDVSAVLSEGARSVVDGFTGDLALSLTYAGAIAALVVFVLSGLGRLGRVSRRGR